MNLESPAASTISPLSAGVGHPDRVPFNLGRSLFHMFNATWGVLLYHFLVPRWLAIAVVGTLTLTLTLAELLRLGSPDWNRRLLRNRLVSAIIRPEERQRVSGATFFGWGVLLSLILLPREAVEAACLVMGFGDSTAALVGTRWGRTRLLGRRTLEGSLAFVAAAFLVVMAMRLALYPGVPMAWTVSFALAGAVCGAVLELVSGRLNDNLTLPVITGALLMLMLG